MKIPSCAIKASLNDFCVANGFYLSITKSVIIIRRGMVVHKGIWTKHVTCIKHFKISFAMRHDCHDYVDKI